MLYRSYHLMVKSPTDTFQKKYKMATQFLSKHDREEETQWDREETAVKFAEILGGYRFQQEVWGRKPPKTQKDINVIFEELFSVLNMYGCHG